MLYRYDNFPSIDTILHNLGNYYYLNVCILIKTSLEFFLRATSTINELYYLEAASLNSIEIIDNELICFETIPWIYLDFN